MSTISTLSRVGGFFVASRYSKWQVTPTNSVASGSQTITVPASVALPDGSIILPFATTNPITIGIGTTQETVTPSAVSISGNVASVTATFSNAHAGGDPVFSGTGGLYEAAADANVNGGGTVLIDGTFTGTAANITAARNLFPSITITDTRTTGGAAGLRAQVTLTNAQLLALQTTAITIAAAPGAAQVLIPRTWTLQYKFLTGAFTIGNADNAFQCEYVGKSTSLFKTNATGFVDQASNQVINASPAVAGQVISQTNSAGLGLEVKLTGTTPALTVGAGSVVVNLVYDVVNLL